MQSYILKLSAGLVQPFILSADLFVYESGAVTGSVDLRILVKPDTGAEIMLRPGQRFRIAAFDGRATRWQVSAVDPLAVITGAVIIGSGEFDDANTLNTFKLDGTFSNTVKVSNSAAEAVPVALAAAQVLDLKSTKINNTTAERIPVSLDPSQSLGTSAPIMAYTNHVALTVAGLGVAAIITPAANINGVIIEQIISSTHTGNLLAKNSVPLSKLNGDLLNMGFDPALHGTYIRRTRVAAGMGVYLWNTFSGETNYNVLITIL